MKLRLRVQFLFTFIFFAFISNGQDKPGITFNKVTAQDFSTKDFTIDTSLGAVIVAEVGKSFFEGNTNGWFTLVHKVKRRVKIIDKKGFDLATVSIQLYKSKTNVEEKLEDVKASTYNLENGSVVESKLNKDDIFKDKLDQNHLVRKFTMPSIREGSIIEYSYTIKSDFLFNLQPWQFQGSYPIAWSEYEVSIPEFFKYVFLSQGYLPFHIKNDKRDQVNYSIIEPNLDAGTRTDRFTISAVNTTSRWVIKNAPAIKEESFTSSLRNHISSVEFQLAAYNFPNVPYKPVMGNWRSVTEELLKDKDFGADLSQANKWVKNEIGTSSHPSASIEEAKRIFRFVQENIKNKGRHGIYLSQPLKETLKNKSGYVADINVLLTMILGSQGFTACPVLLSTRSNGLSFELYPLINKFNYVICKLTIDDVNYYLDASQPHFGFNKLPAYCYNGPARAVNNTFDAEYFSPDSLTESKTTTVMLMLDNDHPTNWVGIINSRLGYHESSDTRQSIAETGKDEYIKKMIGSYTGDLKASEIELVKLDNPEEDMTVKYSLFIDNNNADIIYFSPLIHEGMKENPFKAQKRLYPVEMPYTMNEIYHFKMPIPEGYIIDEAPKSERVMFNENEGMFEYLVYKSDKEIAIKTTVKLNKATFVNEDYDSLREFFDHIVKKQAEQIVLKKK